MYNRVNSPATNSDFQSLLATSPDVAMVIDWINNYISPDEFLDKSTKPEDLFDELELSKWAESHDWKYKPEIEDFPAKELDEWANDNDYIKRIQSETYNLEKLLEGNSNLNLQYLEDGFIIWDYWKKEIVFSGGTMPELLGEINNHFAKIEEEKEKRRVEWAKEVEERNLAKAASKGKRGRPKKSA